jgi:hypothetical protein
LVSRKKWNDLSPSARRLIVAGGVIEGVLKAVALFDIVRRPAREVRGSKPKWVLAIVLVNSVGVVPITYFGRGRRKA